MSTFLQDFSENLENKWREVDVLILAAIDVREQNEPLYNAMCRSITILIVSHLEGFVKDLAKSFISDVNRNMSFRDIPKSFQRTYCSEYIVKGNNDNTYENRIKKLSDKFSDIGCEISHEPFIFENKNPNISIIRNIFINFGFKNIFLYLHKSTIDEIFSYSISEVENLKVNLRENVLTNTEDFPYSLNLVLDLHNIKKKQKVESGRTMCEEFINEVNQHRHEIAHGNNFDNIDDINALKVTKEKTLVLQYALIAILGSLCSGSENTVEGGQESDTTE